MNLPNLEENLLRTSVLLLRPWFLGILSFISFFLFPSLTYARTTTYIGNYEVTVEDSGLKKETVRVAGAMGKVIKSRETNTKTKMGSKGWEYTYYTTDAQGSTRQEITETKPIPKANTYYAYGTPIPAVILSGSEASRVLNAQTQKIEDTYTGQKKDEETGLMYYNARYYNPQTGLFVQADSVDDGQNKYQYVAGNPVNSTDPTGNMMDDGGVGGGGGSIPEGQISDNWDRVILDNYSSLEQELEKSAMNGRYIKVGNTVLAPGFKDLIYGFADIVKGERLSQRQVLDKLISYLHEQISYSESLKPSIHLDNELRAFRNLNRSPLNSLTHINSYIGESTARNRPIYGEIWSMQIYLQKKYLEYKNKEDKFIESPYYNPNVYDLAYRTGSLESGYLGDQFICGNFSLLSKKISEDLLGIPSTVVTVNKSNHAFNSYVISGQQVLGDSTWGSKIDLPEVFQADSTRKKWDWANGLIIPSPETYPQLIEK